jgi:molybdopterin synthase catalytic subunit
MVRLQPEPIRAEELLARARAAAGGAVALFLGIVRAASRERRVLWLQYEAYAEMAEAELARIEHEARGRFAVIDLALVHRTGRLDPGEVAVGVAVVTEHRAEAFEACRFVIDAVKRRAPIWKKEVFDDGAVWVEGAAETDGGRDGQSNSSSSRSSSSKPR